MTARVGLIGHPVGHSFSARFQQAAFDALGIDARYETWDVLPDGLENVIQGLRASGMLGANVTIPYKEAAVRHTDRLHETARFVGAVNTLVHSGEILEGFNTDVSGFQRALVAADVATSGAHAVIWGAGGAARAVAWALIWRGVGAITIVNRTVLRAGRLRHDLSSCSAEARLRAFAGDDPAAQEALAACDLAINCTPVGLRGGGRESETPFAVEALHHDATVVDLVANPAQTVLMQRAQAAGHRVVGGLPMLVYQGAAAFELWTQQEAPLEVMFSAAEAASMEAESDVVAESEPASKSEPGR